MKPSPAVSLLLTNLRLLDYDFDSSSSSSFPITPDVFTSLTNKGKAFEHIIHHLFCTFDPEECALKLQGCWPVYEPAQSRELRNVVFKWLEDLKKSGRLGGVLIRRTTLDDCCGQRYEELLLALSTMVLRDRIEQGGYPTLNPSLAYYQATSTQPSQLYLASLTIAHRHALGSLLDARQNSKAEWLSFSSLLDSKEEALAAMTEQFPEGGEPEDPNPAHPKSYEDTIRRKWKNNWLGDPRWLDIILNGDPESTRDHFLELPFEKAYDKHQYFKQGRAVNPSTVSLKGLENQVAEQRRRVEEIRKLREQSLVGMPASNPRTASPSKAASTKPTEKKGLDVKFTKHQNLHLKDMAGAPRRNRGHRSEYSELLQSLRDEMMFASAPSQRAQDKPEVPIYYHYDSQEQSVAGGSAPAEGLNDGPEVYHLRINLQEENGSTDPGSNDSGIHNDTPSPEDGADEDKDMMDVDDMDIDGGEEKAYCPNKSPELVSQLGPQHNSTSSSISYVTGSDDDSFKPPRTRGTSQRPTHQESAMSPEYIPKAKKPRVRNSLGFGDDELYAEQIISTITGASFSPEKPSPPPVKGRSGARAFMRHQELIDSPLPPPEPFFGFEEDSTMLPHPSFHIDDQSLTTPAKGPVATTPTEDLLMSGDYNSVFKSRPKIALSPTFSPSPDGDTTPVRGLNISMMGMDGGGGGDGDGGGGDGGGGGGDSGSGAYDGFSEDEDDEVMEYIASPLASKVRR